VAVLSGSGGGGGGAGLGGAIFNNSGAVTLLYSTIAGNAAQGGTGGGGHNGGPGQPGQGIGGGIYNFTNLNGSGTSTLQQNIITQNTGTTDPDVSGAFISNGNNLIGNAGSSTGFGATGDQLNVTTPGLGALADNGGPTQTMALQPGSPAIGAGGTSCPATDQRGVARAVPCDIGAYEAVTPLQTGPTFTVTSTQESTGSCRQLQCGLADAINATNAFTGPGPIQIMFNLGGTSIISLTQPLTITTTVSIQAGAAPASGPTLGAAVVLDTSGISSTTTPALSVAADNVTLTGLEIMHFTGTGPALALSGNGDRAVALVVIQNSGVGVAMSGSTGNDTLTQSLVTANGGDGVLVSSGSGNTIQTNDIYGNGTGADGGLNIHLAGGNSSAVTPAIIGATPASSGVGGTTVVGRIGGTAGTYSIDFFASVQCAPDGTGGGQQWLEEDTVNTDATGVFTQTLGFAFSVDFPYLTTTATTSGGTSAFSACVTVSPDNYDWPRALTLHPELTGGTTSYNQYLDQPNEARWYKFAVQPDTQVTITLTNLPKEYDLSLYSDISQAYSQITSTQDLAKASAESTQQNIAAADVAPAAFMPAAFMPAAFMPAAFMPAAFMPAAFMPAASPNPAFSTAEINSLIGGSAFPGTVGQGIRLNTWTSTGYFYIRVHGSNGAYSLAQPFHLTVTQPNGQCAAVVGAAASLPATSLTGSGPAGGSYTTLVLESPGRMAGDTSIMQTTLQTFAQRPEVNGVIVNVSQDARVAAAYSLADANKNCPLAENLAAGAIKNVVTAYRQMNSGLKYVVIVGDDDVIPFFRYPDEAGLGPENSFYPPVLDSSAPQASLRLNYVLGQDEYGSSTTLTFGPDRIPVPQLAVGRLVHTPAEVVGLLNTYMKTVGGVVMPQSSLVTGYDFMQPVASAVATELQTGIGTAPDTLIEQHGLSPKDPTAWTADQLRAKLLDSRHDVIFLAGHFSQSVALAADYSTYLFSTDLTNSSVDLSNALVFSSGCHSGYSINGTDVVPSLTLVPDWPEAFAQKGAELIAGTSYQYGDTDFIKYSNSIYLGFAQQLRAGTGPVSIGDALVNAKQQYLAQTPLLGGIETKSVLEITLYGLPMFSVNMTDGRGPSTNDPSIVTTTMPFATNPGMTLGLTSADVTINPALTTKTETLTNVNTGAGITATYVEGSSGEVVEPNQPVLPLETRNVTAPVADQVLRGAGFRGGSYSDTPGILPLTGAPATELGSAHTSFQSAIFVPAQPWRTNYFGLLADPVHGATHLDVTAAQYQSSGPSSNTGILRQYSSLQFRLFYSNYTGPSAGSAAPSISLVSATTNGGGQPVVTFSMHVVDDPGAGVQQVWVTYTGGSGTPYYGQWQSLDLTQDAVDSTLWTGTLTLPGGMDPSALQYMVQAASGTGLVTLDTNAGAYYTVSGVAGATQGNQMPPPAATMLNLQSPPVSSAYGTTVSVTAHLSSGSTPQSGQQIIFTLGSQSMYAVTGNDGNATASFLLLDPPGAYTLQASFNGTAALASTSASTPFTENKQNVTLTLSPASGSTPYSKDAQVTATLTDAAGVPVAARTIVFVVTDSSGQTQSVPASTNPAGQALLGSLTLPLGTYSISAHFGDIVQLQSGSSTDLADPDYNAAAPASAAIGASAAPATVTFSNLSATYDGTPHTASATALPNWCGPVTLSYTDANKQPVQSPTHAGSYTVQAILANANCQFAAGAATTAPLTIAQASQSITFNALANHTYGDPPFTLSASASSGLPVAFTVTVGPCTISDVQVSMTGSGVCTIAASQAGNTDYAAATPVSQSLTIGKASLTITANNKTMIHGGVVPVFDASYSGLVNNDTSSVVSGLSCQARDANGTPVSSSTAAGVYTIMCSGGVATNYTISYQPGTLTIVGFTPGNLLALSQSRTACHLLLNRGTVTATGVAVNGTSDRVLCMNRGSLRASTIIVQGDVLNFHGTLSGTLRIRQPATPDPLAGLPTPTAPSASCPGAACPDGTDFDRGHTYRLLPGTYSRSLDMDRGAKVCVASGIYVLTASWIVNGVALHPYGSAGCPALPAGIADPGVLLYFQRGTIQLNRHADFSDLSAMCSGPYTGLLYWQLGSAPVTIDGVVGGGSWYEPNGALIFDDGAQMKTPFVAASSIILNRGATLNMTAS
jgi:hypothetical protein